MKDYKFINNGLTFDLDIVAHDNAGLVITGDDFMQLHEFENAARVEARSYPVSEIIPPSSGSRYLIVRGDESAILKMTESLIAHGVAKNFYNAREADKAKKTLGISIPAATPTTADPPTFQQQNEKWHESGTNAVDLQKETELSNADMYKLKQATNLEKLQEHKYDTGKMNFRIDASPKFREYLDAAKGWETQQGQGRQ